MTIATTTPTALDILFAIRLDDGRPWGSVAADFQKEDAAAIFSRERPHLHFLTRPRGGSKTTDIGGVALAWLAAEAPPRARAYVIASNQDQGALLIDAMAGFVSRTPELDGFLTVENERVTAPNGATVSVLPASEHGTWGLLNTHLIVCDEFAQWPETRGARRVWSAVRSTLPKVPSCRLVILTSAGEPSHWSYEIYKNALADDAAWHVREVTGPIAWQSPDDIESLRRELLPSEYDRLVLNIWSESEDRAIAPEDYDAAAVPAQRFGVAPAGLKGGGHRLHYPREGVQYVLAVDFGLQNDSTVLCVAHREQLTEDRHGPQRMVVDHLDRWTGSRRHHVQLADVEERLVELSHEYNGAPIHADPDQFEGSLQRLNRRAVHASPVAFTTGSVSQFAIALVQAFRSGSIEVPDTPELRRELLAVRLRSGGPGMTRLDHTRSGHDDQAVAIALACHLLASKSGFQNAKDFIHMVEEARKTTEHRRSDRKRVDARSVRLASRIIAGRPRFGDPGDAPACRHGRTGRCFECVRPQALGK